MNTETVVIDQDFPDQLRKQLEFISRSCEAFDAGARDEAVRIAQSIRVLFHQTGRSTSLIEHLRATTVNLTTTQEEIGSNEVQRLGLTDFRIQIVDDSPRAEFGAHLSLSFATQVPVSKWWTQVVAVLDKSSQLTRKDIVLNAANKDGGAHVADVLPQNYARLKNPEGAMTFTIGGASFSVEPLHAQYAMIRQMGFELLNSPGLHAYCAGSGVDFTALPGARPKHFEPGKVIRAIAIKYADSTKEHS